MANSETGGGARPISPHLQVYRWPITMATSITHRATGMALYGGSVLLAIWLCSAALGPEAFNAVAAVYGSPVGLLILFGFTWAIFYHLANGVRHLVWDAGAGFKPSTADASGIAVYIISIALTLIAWGWGLSARGGL